MTNLDKLQLRDKKIRLKSLILRLNNFCETQFGSKYFCDPKKVFYESSWIEINDYPKLKSLIFKLKNCLSEIKILFKSNSIPTHQFSYIHEKTAESTSTQNLFFIFNFFIEDKIINLIDSVL